VNQGWRTKSLGDICEFQGGSQPPKSQFVYQEKSKHVRFLQIRDFGSDKNITYIPVSEKNRICEEGDILIGRYGASVGKILTGKAGAYNVALMKTIPNLEVVDRSWFHNYLISDEFQERLRNVAERSAQNGFSKEDIFGFPVPVPPLPDQKRIVGILGEAFDGIATAKASAEKNLQNASALFESHLQSVFIRRGAGWEDKRLGEVCRTGAGGTPLKSNQEYYEGGKIPWLMSGEVSQGEVLSATRFITRKGLENSSARIFPKDTVLVAMYGATAGAVGILRFEAATNQAVCGILPDGKFVPEFLFYVLLSKKRELVDQATGNAQPNISQIKIKNTQIPVISLLEQEDIVASLDSVSSETQRLESIYQQKLAALEALKKSLLHQAFSGQL
jgi:type I restriction enzyme S subunit